jgi:putative ABC transport system substrate-binding protein
MIRGTLTLLVTLALGALAAPLAAAQQPPKVPRVGVLVSGSPATHGFMADAFRQNLRELGHVEGHNIRLEFRWAEGKLDRLPDLAVDLVRLGVNVMVVGGTRAVRAAKNATSTIPIVVWGAGDLVGAGLVASLARPGGNVTGTHDISPELSGKRLQLLKETVPRLSRVAVLWSMPASSLELRETEAAARSVGVQLQLLEVRTPDEFQGAYAAMIRERANALVIIMNSFTLFHRRQLLDLAVKSRLPMVCQASEFASDGCLIAYGPDRLDAIRQAAGFVDRILKGANPGDLPIDQPRKFHLAINLKTAKALGLTISQSLLLRADHVIQ